MSSVSRLDPHLEITTLGVDGLAVKDPINVGFLTCSSTSVAGSLLRDREIGRWLGELFGTILAHKVSVTGTGLCTAGNNTRYITERERERGGKRGERDFKDKENIPSHHNNYLMYYFLS